MSSHLSEKWRNVMSQSVSASMAGRNSEYKASALKEQPKKYSNEKRKTSHSKKKGNAHLQTPFKASGGKQALIDEYANELRSIFNGDPHNTLQMSKIKNTLQSFYLNINADTQISSTSRIGIGNRQFQQIHEKYHHSETQVSVLKAKLQQMEERIKAYQRQIANHRAIDKMMDNSIQRQNELRQQNKALEVEKAQLILQIEQQNIMFSEQAQKLRDKLQKLKINLSRQ